MSTKGRGVATKEHTLPPDKDLAPFGDTFRPETGDSVFRVAFLNIGGFPLKPGDVKNPTIREHVAHLHTSALGLMETNINWNKITPAE